MLVGATARDLLLYHVFGHAVTRATYDLDFAILVDSWEQFAIVKQMFLDIPGFTGKGRNAQRLYYQPTGASFETIIDIIPFGKLETAERTIAWPPDADVVMNVAAFSDVFENSLRAQVRPDLIIPVASLPRLIVLKLFAWLDRHEGRDVQTYRTLEMSTDSAKKRLMNWTGFASTLSCSSTQAGSSAPPHLDYARALHALLRRSCLRSRHVYLLLRPPVPMTASRLGP